MTASSNTPITANSLTADLRVLGVQPGETLLVHCAFSRLGNVYGGPQALIDALQTALTPAGTLVMPTHSTQLSEPSNWQNPPAPEAWWPIIRAELPAYDPERTLTRAMGVLAETFRRYPDVVRSQHPHGSFAAWGKQSQQVVATHELNCIFGEQSPLAALYRLGARILLLGVGHGNNTSLHLAEYRADFPDKRYHTEGAPVSVDGERQWVTFEELIINSDDFVDLGAAYEQQQRAPITGSIGDAQARLLPMPELVDYAVDWFEQHR